MKKYLLVALLLLASNMSYAELKRHNLQVNVGGGPSYLFPRFSDLFTRISETEFNAGGGFTVELGYLFHSVRASGLVHGFDLRADFTMGFTSGETDLILSGTQSLYGGIAMTYTLGWQSFLGRLMFDVIGYGITYSSTESVLTYSTLTETEKVSGIVAQYVLPGLQYIMPNGLTIGLRNKFKINFGDLGSAGLFGLDTMVSLGYTFGSGKQPGDSY